MFSILMTRELTELPEIETRPGVYFSQDAKGHTITVGVYKEGHPYSLTGKIRGYIVRSNRSTVTINGSLQGNTATVTLPDSAYAVPGPIVVVIKVMNNDETEKTTLAALRCTVERSRFS